MTKLILSLSLILMFLAVNARGQYQDVNYALSLNGSSYLSVANHDDLNSELQKAGAFSIDAWVHPAAYQGIMTVVGNDYSSGYWFGLNAQGFILFKPNGYDQYLSSSTVPLNTWTHIAASYNIVTREVRIFINGSINQSQTMLQGYIGTCNSDLRIGADRLTGGGPGYYWYGEIDEVRIWSSAIDFSSAAGLLYRIPHGVMNGMHGKYLAGGWRLNGTLSEISGTKNASAVGPVMFSSSPLPPHYTRICSVFLNRQQTPVAGGTLDCFVLPLVKAFSLTQNYTLECWIKPAAQSGHGTYQTIVQKGSKYAGVWSYWLGLDKKANKLYFVPNGDFGDGVSSANSLPLNQWTHIAATYSVSAFARTARLYVNGLPAGSKSYTSDASTNSYPVLIGNSDGGLAPPNAYGYAGCIDELRIWNDVRSRDEIADNYLLELSGPHTGLVAAYKFDGDIEDRSGNARNGNSTLDASSEIYFRDASDLPAFPSITVVSPNGGEEWVIGREETIQWNSSGLYNVRLELSRDGGASYELLESSVSATPPSYSLKPVAPATADALIRITTPTPTSVEDVSDKPFSIAPPPALQISPLSLYFAAPQNGSLPFAQQLQIDNSGGGSLQWSCTWSATQWLDVQPSAGEGNSSNVQVSVLTTALPEGIYEDTIVFDGNASNAGLGIPVQYLVTSKRLFDLSGTVRYQLPTGQPIPAPDILIRISGDAQMEARTNRDGNYAFTGLPEGNYRVEPIDPYCEFLPAFRQLKLDYNASAIDFTARPLRGSMLLTYAQGWNLISLPLDPDIHSLPYLFADALPPAYRYENTSGYVIADSILFGDGYWINFSRDGSVLLDGFLQRFLIRTLSAESGGWNLTGVPSAPSNLSSIIQDPEYSIVQLYEFDPWFGYRVPFGGALTPGKAYWMRSINNALIRMEPLPPSMIAAPFWKTHRPSAVYQSKEDK